MAFPRRSSRSPRSRYTLGLLLLTAVTLLALDLPGTGPLQPVRNVLASAFRPIRSAGDVIFEPIGNGWKGAFGYGEVKDDNDRLRARLEDAKSDEAELARLKIENAELKKMLDVKVENVTTRTARVVSEPLQSFDSTVEIDVGSGEGVKEGMAVVAGLAEGSGGALMGKVDSIQGGRSKVELLSSPDFVVGVSLEGGQKGVLTGQGSGRPLLIDRVAGVADVKKGDFVFTSGIDESAFPADLKVGRVADVQVSSDGQSQRLTVEPMVDFASVYVKVALKDPPR